VLCPAFSISIDFPCTHQGLVHGWVGEKHSCSWKIIILLFSSKCFIFELANPILHHSIKLMRKEWLLYLSLGLSVLPFLLPKEKAGAPQSDFKTAETIAHTAFQRNFARGGGNF